MDALFGEDEDDDLLAPSPRGGGLDPPPVPVPPARDSHLRKVSREIFSLGPLNLPIYRTFLRPEKAPCGQKVRRFACDYPKSLRMLLKILDGASE